MYINGLIIGRFQPLHNGHLNFIREVDQMKLEKIILGIGDECIGRTPWNPFTFDEVKQMWLPEIAKLVTPVEIYKIPDIHNSEHYASHVESITGCDSKKTIIFSGNGATLDCFTNYGKDYQVRSLGKHIPLNDNGYVCATNVREMIGTNKDWKKYVPKSTKKMIQEVGGVNIIKGLGGNYGKK